MTVIVSNCKGLVELNLDNYHRWAIVFDKSSLCPESINFICENLTESIRKLSLFNQDNITDSHVETLLIRCNKITELDVINALQISAVALNTIIDNLPKLTHLLISLYFHFDPITKDLSHLQDQNNDSLMIAKSKKKSKCPL